MLLSCLMAFAASEHGWSQRTSLGGGTTPRAAGGPEDNWIPIAEYIARVEHPRVQEITIDPTPVRVEESDRSRDPPATSNE
jgi:hypothetical protein